jgi:leader peptidase (prepilin peptidase)/N-methyltransferase
MIEMLISGSIIICLLVLSWIDLRTMTLPDPLTYSLIAIGFLSNHYSWIQWTSSSDSLLGALAGFFLVYGTNLLYKVVRKQDGIGLGDAKLLAGLGACLGFESLILILFIASITGLVGGWLWLKINHLKNSHPFPFGPYIAFSGIILIIAKILH